MSMPLRVLIVEDYMDDALLLLRELRQGGYDPTYELVDTAEAMNAALDQQQWDIVISDYVMPQFSGLDALELLKAKGIDLPFIIVSGKIGEDVAVQAMKAGAHDYLLKDNLTRLAPAVDRELADAEVRRKRRQAEEERDHLLGQMRKINEQLIVSSVQFKEGEEKYQRLIAELEAVINSMAETIMVFGLDGKIVRTNPRAIDLLGLSSEEQAKPITELWAQLRPETENGRPISPDDSPPVRALRGETVRGVVALIHQAADGKPVWVSISASPIHTNEGKPWGAVAMFTDITSLRKQ